MSRRRRKTPPETREPPRRRLPLLIGLVVVVVIAVGATVLWLNRQPAYTGPARHVIVISLDTTRADYLGCYGHPWIKTPNLDKLAGESILLTDYLTAATTTLASHVSLLTGKYPHSHGVPRNGFMVSRDNVMLPELLHEVGFTTAGFIASFSLDQRFDFAQGYDHWDQQYEIRVGDSGADQNQRRADAVTDAVLSYLDQQGVPEHLFLFVHYFDPHLPYTPPAPYDREYLSRVPEVKLRPDVYPELSNPRTRRAAQLSVTQHAGEISYMDEHLGRLLDELRRRGVLDDALLVLTSDHGENLGDAPGTLFDHGWTVYQTEAHCVGMIRLPKAAQAGTRCEALVGSPDLLPTITTYLGLTTPAGVDGEPLDLAHLPAADVVRPRFSEATKPWEEVETDPRWLNARKACCVRSGPYKYIRTDYRNLVELYNLAADPQERKNLLAGPQSEATATIAADLARLLDAWCAAAAPLPSSFEPGQMSETMARLRSLGYLGPEPEEDDGNK
ncbi:MAG: sulfatase-like hydrolase/transferase [Phycisphaerae bacterium]|jgi:arylsulfatase A-like enzyme